MAWSRVAQGGTGISGGTTENTTTSASSTNMDSTSLDALKALIVELLGGGSSSYQTQLAQRQQELEALQAQRAGYSKEAAFSDAAGAMQAQLSKSLQELLPTITRASEGAGTSQNSMRALLTQEAAQNASDSAATLGLNAATNYGSIATNLSALLEKLTQPDTANTEALINALSVAKGAVTSGTETSTTTKSGTNNTSYGGTASSGATSGSGSSLGTSSSKGTTASSDSGFYSVAPLISASTDPDSISNDAWSAMMRGNGFSDGSQLYDALNKGSWSDRLTF